MEVCGDTRRNVQELKISVRDSSVANETTEISCLSPSTPPSEKDTTPTPSPTNHHVFAAHLQMKLKSHLEESSSSSSSSTEEFYTNSSSTSTHEEDNTNSSSEIFYDFDDVVAFENGEHEELTSDYGTGGSNSTIVGGGGSTRSNSSSSSDTSEGGGNGGGGVVEEEEVSSVRRYQRSSSLKSGKTPPGTPMKKIVRFADAMGLDLTDIKVFLDEIPRVPKEAYRDLHIPDYQGPTSGSSISDTLSDSWSAKPFGLNLTRSSTLNFVPLFHQPVTMPDFFDKIRDQKVLLENAFLTQETVSNTHSSVVACKHVIKGTVRVMNLDFHKSVYVRYTYNDWKELVELMATYIQGSCDGFSDRFEFRIEIDETKLPPPYIRDHDDAKITFACRFHCQGTQFWDNNNSRNYVFQNVPLCTKSDGVVSNVPRPSMFSSTSRYSSFDDFDYTCNRLDNGSSKEIPKVEPQKPLQQAPPATTTPIPQQTPTTPTSTCTRDIQQQSSISSAPSVLSTGGGGGSHLSGSLYSPTSTSSFYEPAYGCYSNYGSACFY